MGDFYGFNLALNKKTWYCKKILAGGANAVGLETFRYYLSNSKCFCKFTCGLYSGNCLMDWICCTIPNQKIIQFVIDFLTLCYWTN